MKGRSIVLVLLVLVMTACGGGGGGGGTGPTVVTPPATTPPATQPPSSQPSGGGPTIAVTTGSRAGRAPLEVFFDLCGSRDGSGGTALSYLVDFEGGGLVNLGGCGFSHRFASNGVSVFDTQLCVQDSAGRRACETIPIKAYIGLDVRVDQTTGCQSTVIAVATEVQGQAGGVRALAMLDQVRFEAFVAATNKSLGTKEGSKSGGTWRSGTWNVNSQEKLRVVAVGYANRVAGDDVPEASRPACNP